MTNLNKKIKVPIYTIINISLLVLLFIFFLPFLIDVSSNLFVNKSLNFFAFAKLFPLVFNYLHQGINLWIGSIFGSICFLYIVLLFYFNIHFIKVIFNRSQWAISYTIILIIGTLILAIVVLMMMCSFSKFYRNFRTANFPLYVYVAALFPGLDFVTGIVFMTKAGPFLAMGVGLFWFSIMFIIFIAVLAFLLRISFIFSFRKNKHLKINNNQAENVDKTEFIDSSDQLSKCPLCQVGFLEIKPGNGMMIVKCNNQNQCQYVMLLSEFIFQFFQENGIKIYQWPIECWKCQKNIYVYTYLPSYQLKQVLKNFTFHFGGLGLFPTLDEYLKNNYQTISDYFNPKLNKTVVDNICIYCGVAQGKYAITINPFIQNDVKDNNLDQKYLDRIVNFNICPLSENEVANCFTF